MVWAHISNSSKYLDEGGGREVAPDRGRRVRSIVSAASKGPFSSWKPTVRAGTVNERQSCASQQGGNLSPAGHFECNRHFAPIDRRSTGTIHARSGCLNYTAKADNSQSQQAELTGFTSACGEAPPKWGWHAPHGPCFNGAEAFSPVPCRCARARRRDKALLVAITRCRLACAAWLGSSTKCDGP